MWYSQKDERWAKTRIGNSNTTFEQSGCLLTTLSNLDAVYHGGIGRTPLEIMNILLLSGAMNKNGEVDLNKAAQALNMKYKYSTAKPKDICMAETNYYLKDYGVPQHFFLVNPATSEVIDPLDQPDKIGWKKKPQGYKIISWRLLKYK